MLGALVGETLLIEWCGVRGTGALGGVLSLTVAGLALALASRLEPADLALDARRAEFTPLSALAGCFLAAAFLSGGILLALEVVWFRFLHLFLHGGSLTFAVMLATVLAGIGLGRAAGGLVVAPRSRCLPSRVADLHGTASQEAGLLISSC